MFEIWFSYRGSRRFRTARDEVERDQVVEFLSRTADVTDVQVIEEAVDG